MKNRKYNIYKKINIQKEYLFFSVYVFRIIKKIISRLSIWETAFPKIFPSGDTIYPFLYLQFHIHVYLLFLDFAFVSNLKPNKRSYEVNGKMRQQIKVETCVRVCLRHLTCPS